MGLTVLQSFLRNEHLLNAQGQGLDEAHFNDASRRTIGEDITDLLKRKIGINTDAAKVNNLRRQILLDAVLNRYGSLAAIPKRVLDALKIDDFSLSKKDGKSVVTSGRPLTDRRIRTILSAITLEDNINKELDKITNNNLGNIRASYHLAKSEPLPFHAYATPLLFAGKIDLVKGRAKTSPEMASLTKGIYSLIKQHLSRHSSDTFDPNDISVNCTAENGSDLRLRLVKNPKDESFKLQISNYSKETVVAFPLTGNINLSSTISILEDEIASNAQIYDKNLVKSLLTQRVGASKENNGPNSHTRQLATKIITSFLDIKSSELSNLREDTLIYIANRTIDGAIVSADKLRVLIDKFHTPKLINDKDTIELYNSLKAQEIDDSNSDSDSDEIAEEKVVFRPRPSMSEEEINLHNFITSYTEEGQEAWEEYDKNFEKFTSRLAEYEKLQKDLNGDDPNAKKIANLKLNTMPVFLGGFGGQKPIAPEPPPYIRRTNLDSITDKEKYAVEKARSRLIEITIEKRATPIKNFVADIFYSADTLTYDEEAMHQTSGTRLSKVFTQHKDTIVSLLLDRTQVNILPAQIQNAINLMLDKISSNIINGKSQEELNEGLRKLGRFGISTAMSFAIPKLSQMREIPVVDAKGQPIVKNGTQLMHQINDFAIIDQEISNCVKSGMDEIQKEVIQNLGKLVNMGEEANDEENIEVLEPAENANPEAPEIAPLKEGIQTLNDQDVWVSLPPKTTIKIPEAQLNKNIAKAKTRELVDSIIRENKTLDELLKSSLSDMSSGQGAFLKNILSTYFKNADILDQRSMISAMIRFSPIEHQTDIKYSFTEEEDEKFAKLSTQEQQNFIDSKIEERNAKYKGETIGALFKGAGPILQKELQGIAPEAMNKVIAYAVADMKSNLAPIPDNIIKAHLLDIVNRSNGEISNITVLKSLGAASVGQTLLCQMKTKEHPEGEEVVVKILRPDAKARANREKAIFFNAAAPLPGMTKTFEGRLQTILDELDLTIEARNVVEGKNCYGDGTFTTFDSMQLHPLVAPTTNTMVILKAPGETLDSYIKNAQKKIDNILRPFVTGKNPDGTLRTEHHTFAQTKHAHTQLRELLDELSKFQNCLIDFTTKWVTEALYGLGFSHNDLHPGNGIISKDKLTIIDFGNAAKLTKEQQSSIVKMICGATGSTPTVKLFMEGYEEILSPQGKELYSLHKTSLKMALDHIFANEVGGQATTKEDIGKRIFTAILLLQKMGLEVPGPIFNFSKGQTLLQNSISELNAIINTVRDAFTSILGIHKDEDIPGKIQKVNMSEFDPITSAISKLGIDKSPRKNNSNRQQPHNLNAFNRAPSNETQSAISQNIEIETQNLVLGHAIFASKGNDINHFTELVLTPKPIKDEIDTYLSISETSQMRVFQQLEQTFLVYAQTDSSLPKAEQLGLRTMYDNFLNLLNAFYTEKNNYEESVKQAQAATEDKENFVKPEPPESYTNALNVANEAGKLLLKTTNDNIKKLAIDRFLLIHKEIFDDDDKLPVEETKNLRAQFTALVNNIGNDTFPQNVADELNASFQNYTTSKENAQTFENKIKEHIGNDYFNKNQGHSLKGALNVLKVHSNLQEENLTLDDLDTIFDYAESSNAPEKTKIQSIMATLDIALIEQDAENTDDTNEQTEIETRYGKYKLTLKANLKSNNVEEIISATKSLASDPTTYQNYLREIAAIQNKPNASPFFKDLYSKTIANPQYLVDFYEQHKDETTCKGIGPFFSPEGINIILKGDQDIIKTIILSITTNHVQTLLDQAAKLLQGNNQAKVTPIFLNQVKLLNQDDAKNFVTQNYLNNLSALYKEKINSDKSKFFDDLYFSIGTKLSSLKATFDDIFLNSPPKPKTFADAMVKVVNENIGASIDHIGLINAFWYKDYLVNH